jgi:hypothetical protein
MLVVGVEGHGQIHQIQRGLVGQVEAVLDQILRLLQLMAQLTLVAVGAVVDITVPQVAMVAPVAQV